MADDKSCMGKEMIKVEKAEADAMVVPDMRTMVVKRLLLFNASQRAFVIPEGMGVQILKG